jgi:hypothetical protein
VGKVIDEPRPYLARRIDALAPLRLTPRQAAFLAFVALHGGVCVRREYAPFASVHAGKATRDFLD